jgi:tetratricopeptide (TPR) repeat protein
VRRLQGRQQDAVNLLRQASARERSDSLVRNNLAWLLALEGKGDEALEVIQSAIALRGEQANLLDTRAVVYIAKEKHALAVKDLEEAIAETPTSHRYFHLAQAQLGVGNQAAARGALKRGQDLGLNESSVDPLERPAFRQLLARIDRR